MRLARGGGADGRAPGYCCSLSHWAQKCSRRRNRKWCFLLGRPATSRIEAVGVGIAGGEVNIENLGHGAVVRVAGVAAE